MSRSALDKEEKQAAARLRQQQMANQMSAQMVYPTGYVMPGYPVPGMPMTMPPPLPYGMPMAAMPPAPAYEIEEKKKDEIPQTNTNTYGVNKLVLERIYESDYYNSLYECNTFQELCDEVQRKVSHTEPWATGTSRTPSSGWCLLVKFFKLRLTIKQANSMIRRRGSPYIRALGFLYLRLVTEPKGLWGWMEEFIDDDESFAPSANPELKMTMGRFCQKILTDMHFYDTVLPRIPVPIERKLKAYLILAEQEHERAVSNMRILHRLKQGVKVQAIYTDEETEPAFFEATVQEVVEPEDEGMKPKVVVTYNEYGNTECIALGKIMLNDEGGGGYDNHDDRSGGGSRRSYDRDERDRSSSRRQRSRSRDRGGGHDRRYRSRSRSGDRRDRGDRDRSHHGDGRHGDHKKGRSPPNENGGSLLDSVMGKVTERDRNRSAASGKDYASRPASYKGSLSLKLDRFTHRKKSRSRSPELRSERPRASERRERDRDQAEKSEVYETSQGSSRRDDSKARYLKDRYGDASRH